ncbi:hypothetical protein DFQ30_003853 [Apophysomyces sp. BC1015]|nr:hypothetical protein DFQ30_003853 [Apophysomyces sp. BC1015]
MVLDRCETEDEDEDDEDDLPVHLPLPDILAWIDARIAHGARVAILQECYRYRQETSFEELRSRQYRPRRLAPPPRSKKQQKKPDRFTPASCSAAGVTPTVEDASLIVSVPLHPDLIEQKLAALAQSASDYHDLSSEHARSLRMRIDRLASRRATGFVTMGQVEFQVLGKLGEGGAAHLYLVRQAHGQEQRTEVLKVETPANPWEAYVLQQLATRLADPNRVIAARGCFVYQDSSFLLLDYASQGTLLDALNRQRQIHGTQGMPEPLAMLLTAELCRSLLAIHACGIVHGDLKLDNVVLAVDPAEQPHHQRQQRLKLIDFGRAIDLTLFPAGVRLLASWEPDTTDAQQIRRGEPWAPWTIDYWNTAAMAHWLLFGQPIKTAEEAHETRLQQPLKRYWQRQAWHDFFHCMLNPPQSPMTTKIEHIIDTFDHCLHAERTKTDSRLHMLVSQLQTATTKA